MGGATNCDVRPVVERSWRRLASAGIDPDRLEPRRAIDHAELDYVRASSPLSHVIDVLRRCLVRFADDSEHVMVVVDNLGRVLWMEGHNSVHHRADKIMFREGMYWTEDSAGTNAIGTALAIDHAVQIFSAEHFLREQHPWWCSAAPIHNPLTGQTIGIVDLSGALRTAHPDSLALVVAAAGIAEEALALRQAAQDDRLRQAFLNQTPERTRGRRALLTPDGRILLAEPAGWLEGRLAPPLEGCAILHSGVEAEAEPLDGGGWVSGSPPSARDRRTPQHCCSCGARPWPVQRSGRCSRAGRAERPSRRDPGSAGDASRGPHLPGAYAAPVRRAWEPDLHPRRDVEAETADGGGLSARLYRLTGEVSGDFLEVERQLSIGNVQSGARDLLRTAAPVLSSTRNRAGARRARGRARACS